MIIYSSSFVFFDPFLALILIEFIFLFYLTHPVLQPILQVQLTQMLLLLRFVENNAEAVLLKAVVPELHLPLIGPFKRRREQRIYTDST